MKTDERIKAFVQVGEFLSQFSETNTLPANSRLNNLFAADFTQLINTVHIHNPWFTPDNVRNAVAAIASSLQKEKLVEWLSHYIHELDVKKPKQVAVIMAGNIPMVGFHDMLCVLVSGNKFIGKLSSDDKLLLPFVAKVLIEIAPEFAEFIEFTEDRLKNIEAVIATGSNNTARYFDYYFGKYPHIIRKNRNSVAVLTGSESAEELRLLGEDVFRYFGLGCRNVSKLFVPRGYNFDGFYGSIIDFDQVISNNKYMNNYEYNRTVYLMSSDSSLLDNNFLLLKEDASYASPIGMLFYEYYDDLSALNERLKTDATQIQCAVGKPGILENVVPFGAAQCPGLMDYADGIDTMQFLIKL